MEAVERFLHLSFVTTRSPNLLPLPTGVGFLPGFEHVMEKVLLWSAVVCGGRNQRVGGAEGCLPLELLLRFSGLHLPVMPRSSLRCQSALWAWRSRTRSLTFWAKNLVMSTRWPQETCSLQAQDCTDGWLACDARFRGNPPSIVW